MHEPILILLISSVVSYVVNFSRMRLIVVNTIMKGKADLAAMHQDAVPL